MANGSQKNGGEEPQRRQWALLVFYLALLVGVVWVSRGFAVQSPRDTIPYSQFKQHLEKGEVLECQVEDSQILGLIEPKEPSASSRGREAGDFQFRTFRVEDPDLVQELLEAGVRFEGVRPSTITPLLLTWIVPLLLIVFIWIFAFRRLGTSGQSALNFGRSKARLVADKETGVDFDDVAGCEEAKAELYEVVDFLRNPQRYQSLGAQIPKGVLLVGPPGTGKTLLARAVAGEAKVPYFYISGSDFVEMFVGVGAARVRDLFAQAKKQAPCIIFVDELDAIGRQRGVSVSGASDEREQTLNQLLVEMDGFEINAGVILLSATNRPDVLDLALLRPGRFDRQVVIDAPDLDGREAILKVHARNKPLSEEVDLRLVAKETSGFSGADLANALNEAALSAARRKRSEIIQDDLEEAVEKVVAGPERRSRRLDPQLRRRIAYHEAGHALVAAHSPHADPVRKITIVPRGQAALGYTLQLPADNRYLMTRAQMLDQIQGLLGGRAAEELVLGEVSTGAENDLERATALARQMILLFGMSEDLGLVHYGQRPNAYLPADVDGSLQGEYSPQTAHRVDLEVKSILDRAYQKAQAALARFRDQLDRVAHELIRRETLSGDEFRQLIGLASPEDSASRLPSAKLEERPADSGSASVESN